MKIDLLNPILIRFPETDVHVVQNFCLYMNLVSKVCSAADCFPYRGFQLPTENLHLRRFNCLRYRQRQFEFHCLAIIVFPERIFTQFYLTSVTRHWNKKKPVFTLFYRTSVTSYWNKNKPSFTLFYLTSLTRCWNKKSPVLQRFI